MQPYLGVDIINKLKVYYDNEKDSRIKAILFSNILDIIEKNKLTLDQDLFSFCNDEASKFVTANNDMIFMRWLTLKTIVNKK